VWDLRSTYRGGCGEDRCRDGEESHGVAGACGIRQTGRGARVSQYRDPDDPVRDKVLLEEYRATNQAKDRTTLEELVSRPFTVALQMGLKSFLHDEVPEELWQVHWSWFEKKLV